jgi:antirestriction protein ArdC
MSTNVYEHISSQITNEWEGGARSRLKPWNAEYAKERITHLLRGISRADVRAVSHAAA